MTFIKYAAAMTLAAGTAIASPTGMISSGDYSTIQAAIDANPGEMIYIPNGRHEIDASLMIEGDGGGLYGPGTIVQTSTEQCLVRVHNAENVTIKDVTLSRPEGATDTTQEGLFIRDSLNIIVDGVKVIDNRGPGGSITIVDCESITVRDSFIENYKSLFIDDRMNPPELYGYAFQAIDGTGIKARYVEGLVVRGNRIVESHFQPTRESVDSLGLGKITKVAEKLGRLAPVKEIENGYTPNWHQGSAIVVTGLGHSRFSIITENYIENAAQGIDMHQDNVILSNNIVDGAIIGTKAMHGSRNILIEGNQFLRCDLWGILLQPGAGSHPARSQKEDSERYIANTDGGTIIANNIISDFGYGMQHWNWKGFGSDAHECAILLREGQLAENPPLKDVLITGNLVYDNGRDGIIQDGKPVVEPPRFRYAIYVEQDLEPKPQNYLVRNNLFNKGSKGVANFNISDH